MLTSEIAKRINGRFDDLGLRLPSGSNRHAEYLRLLHHWNKKINLTALKLDPLSDEAIDRLVIEPVLASSQASASDVVVDIGTGSGSPALPFAIECQAQELVMIESRSRKCAFLREAARVLNVAAKVVEARFEESVLMGDIEHRGSVVTIRAVRIDSVTTDLIRHVISSQGRLFRFSSSMDARLGPEFVITATSPLVPLGSSVLEIASIA